MSEILTRLPGCTRYSPNPRVVYVAFDSLGDLIELALDYKRREAKENCRYLFRGETKCFPTIQPSLFNTRQKASCEHLFYQKALSSMPKQFHHLRTTFDCLTQMRHYEFPTRILDVTENILSALFMALNGWRGDARNAFQCDHPETYSPSDPFPCPRIDVIRVPNGCIKEAESDLVTNISCLAKTKDEFTLAMLWHEIRKEIPDFDEDVFLENFKKLFSNWCVYPRLTNPRIQMQQGLFILFGLSQEALCGRSVECFHDKKQCKDWSLKKTANLDRQYTPLSRTPFSNEISHVAWLMPSVEFVGKYTSFKDYIESLSNELATLGYSTHMMYCDDFVKHADYWREHVKPL